MTARRSQQWPRAHPAPRGNAAAHRRLRALRGHVRPQALGNATGRAAPAAPTAAVGTKNEDGSLSEYAALTDCPGRPGRSSVLSVSP
jgi:hypothetical protein